MTTWILTDPHFEHRSLRDWAPRPENHEDRMAQACNDLIRGEDLLILLGDLHFGPAERLPHTLARLNPHGARMILTRGNHDKATEAKYWAQGVTVMDAFSYRGLYFSHMGSRTLPDDARG